MINRPVALVITRNLPPLVGGMERLVWHIIDGLRPEWGVHVIGPSGCGTHLPPEVAAIEIPVSPLWRFLLLAKFAAVRQALYLRPKLVIAGSGLTAPFAWLAARLAGGRCVIYLHGLDVEARHPIYRLLWRPFFKHFDQVLVNSRFTRELALEAGVPKYRIAILNPGVTLPNSANAANLRTQFRDRYKLENAPVMLYVGRITARKGLGDFIRYSFSNIIEKIPTSRLVVIGGDPPHALLGNTGERARIDKMLLNAGIAHCVIFLGERAQNDPELEAAYFAADVSVFPAQQRAHDNEGFGMVAIEAAAHGLPTVAFDVGGISDAVADGVSGTLITPGQFEEFSRAVCSYLQLPADSRKTTANKARAFAAEFEWSKFTARLRDSCRNAPSLPDRP